jgi:hypothetical protein
MADEKKKSSEHLKTVLIALIGLGILGIIVFTIWINQDATAGVVKFIWQNLPLVGFIVLAAYILMTQVVTRKVQTWTRPSGMELLLRALKVCPDFREAKITYESIPKKSENWDIKHDNNEPVYHYVFIPKQGTYIPAAFSIIYNPLKPGDWEPKVTRFEGYTKTTADQMAREKNPNPFFTETDIYRGRAS